MEFSEIDSIEFGLLSDELKHKISVAKIDIPESLEEQKNGSLSDRRLGTIRDDYKCPTCDNDYQKCEGHFGHIDLEDAEFHVSFLSRVHEILQVVCHSCGKLYSENTIKFKKALSDAIAATPKGGKSRYKLIKEVVKKIKSCSKEDNGCGTPRPSKVRKEDKPRMVIVVEYTTENKEDGTTKIEENYLDADACYYILSNMNDEDCRILGYNPDRARPADMITKTISVPPIAVRPYFKNENMTCEDDLTHKLGDIIKIDNRIKKHKEIHNPSNPSSLLLKELKEVQQFHYRTYIDNDSVGAITSTQRNGKAIKSLSSRFRKKEGRVRGNLMGKRVNYSGRTVITPDPGLDIDEVGVPLKIASILTFPEIVTPENIDDMRELVKRGREYPGANFVVLGNKQLNERKGGKIDLRFGRDTIDLKVGDTVHRHIISGDYILFNRQPSLHRYSMLGMRVNVIQYDDGTKYLTFRMNPCTCKCFNADFDGDEMNVHVPQTVQTMLELKYIVSAQLNQLSGGNNSIHTGLIMDALTASWLATYKTITLNRSEVMTILTNTNLDLSKVCVDKEEYNGWELFSFILPKEISRTQYGDDGKPNLEIQNGKMTKGVLKKNLVGSAKGSILEQVYNILGPYECANFINNLQKMMNWFMINRGFTISIGDVDVKKEIKDEISDMVDVTELEVMKIISDVENKYTDMDYEMGEQLISQKLTEVRNNGQKILAKEMSKENNLFAMAEGSKSKGNPTNNLFIAGCVGQQEMSYLKGSRVEKSYNGRTLPWFYCNDDSSAARGFIPGGYIDGVSICSYIYLMKAAREGAIDTAVKSVSSDTELFIIENGKLKTIEIGEWIDQYLDNKDNKEKIKYYGQEDANMELLDISKLGQEVIIPSTDSYGNMSYEKVTNITRHDPSEYMYEIKTKSGRMVKVVESKSLLIWNSKLEKYEPKDTLQVKKGDFVPLTINFESNQDGLSNVIYSSAILEDETTYKIVKDTLLDEIIEINKYKSKENEKVYDITVPTTKNFGLANGLQVYDTSETGYIQRRIIKLLEDCKVHYDYSVRVANGNIIQYIYGDDCIDTIRLKKIKANFITYGDKRLRRELEFSSDELKKLKTIKNNNDTNYYDVSKLTLEINNNYYKKIINYRDKLRKYHLKFNRNAGVFDTSYFISVDVTYLVSYYSNLNKENKVGVSSDLHPGYIEACLKSFISDVRLLTTNVMKKLRGTGKGEKNKMVKKSKFLLKAIIHYFLAPKKCIFDYKLSKKQFNEMVKKMVSEFRSAIINPGEMVGCITAQSVGEPTTQMNLNTFHHAGQSSKGSGSLGVPRMEELLSISKSPKAPMMTIFLEKDYQFDEKKSNLIRSYIEEVYLKDLSDSVKVYYDPDKEYMKKDKIENIFYTHKNSNMKCSTNYKQLDILFRIHLNKESLFEKEISLMDIRTQFCTFWTDRKLKSKKEEKYLFDRVIGVAILSNYDNSEKPTIHIRLKINHMLEEDLTEILDIIMNKFRIRGIDNINNAYCFDEYYVDIDEDSKELTTDNKEYIITTDGINLEDIRKIKGVDLNRSISNDVH